MALLERLVAENPREALWIGAAGHPLARELRQRLPGLVLHNASPDDLPLDRRVPLAIVCGILETLTAGDARALLAALRDRVAAHTLLVVDLARSPLPDSELRALALRAHVRDGEVALYGVDLFDYKDRPEWLDARHWANPELWDKFRW